MEGEETENAQLSDAEAAALQSNSETEADLTPKDKGDFRPHSRAKERIQGLVEDKKRAYAELQAERLSKQELIEKLKSLESKVDSVSAKANEKPGTWDQYSTDDLYAVKARYLDPGSDQHSIPMSIKIDQEINARTRKEMESKMRSEYEGKQRSLAENQRVYNETRALLGEQASELDNPESPFAKLARQRYLEAAQRYGEDYVVSNPWMQRDAILRAYAELQRFNAAQRPNREAELLRQKMSAKDALSANGEAAVEELSEVNNALAKRDIKKAFSMLPMFKGMAADVETMKTRRR